MRHVWSLIAGIVVAPLAWGLLAMGQTGATATVEAWAKANHFNTADLIEPAIYLAVAGILLGIIGTLRISPLGALVAAVAYLGVNVAIFINPFATRDAVPNNWTIADRAIALHEPMLNGSLLVIGFLLLIAALSLGRWRGAAFAAPAPAGQAAAPAAGTLAGPHVSADAAAPVAAQAPTADAPTTADQPAPAETPVAETPVAETPVAETPVTEAPVSSAAADAESTPIAPQQRTGSHDADDARPVGEPAGPIDTAGQSTDNAAGPAGDERESGESPWSAPPRGTDRSE